MDLEGQKMADEELRRMESRCIIRICLTGYGEEFEDKYIKNTKCWFEIKVHLLVVCNYECNSDAKTDALAGSS